MSKKSLMVAAAITTLSAVGAMGLQTVNAAAGTSTHPMSSLVQKIATKFNLNKDSVQQVVDGQRREMEATRDQEIKNQLAQAVKDGKLTQDKSDKITAKLAEMKANRSTATGKTDAERRAAKQTARNDLNKWATDNGIPTEYLQLISGGHGGSSQGNGSASVN